ncbi:hypothetical protein [Hydrogenophilus thiooxidans]|uniref:hypothetical protein n=1 Tax=Hydrogenophilus thiooxidans TaxID=2820326 RepID=UPI001C22B551|nr:hypothetical protein [Hydrogenophilus thiooxidans]
MTAHSNNATTHPALFALRPPGWLGTEAGERLVERLEYLRHTPSRIVWVGEGTDWTDSLAARYPNAACCGYRPDEPATGGTPTSPAQTACSKTFLARLKKRFAQGKRKSATVPFRTANPLHLPEAPGGIDLLLSNLLLYRTQDPEPLLAAWQPLLAENAALFFVTLGPDTLKELKAALAHRDAPLPWPPFWDMHDLGDILVRLRYAEPVMDMQMLTVRYERSAALLADWGPWLGEAATERLRAIAFPFTVTVELVFGHAWRVTRPKPPRQDPRAPRPIVWQPRPGKPQDPGTPQNR